MNACSLSGAFQDKTNRQQATFTPPPVLKRVSEGSPYDGTIEMAASPQVELADVGGPCQVHQDLLPASRPAIDSSTSEACLQASVSAACYKSDHAWILVGIPMQAISTLNGHLPSAQCLVRSPSQRPHLFFSALAKLAPAYCAVVWLAALGVERRIRMCGPGGLHM